jgi:hypothetical protein
MALVFATKNGNWSDTTVWNTGSLPTSADDVYANNFTVTVDINVTVLTLNTRAGAPAVQGGLFQITTTNNITITATNGFFNSNLASGNCVNRTISTGQSTVTLNGNVNNGGQDNQTIVNSIGNLIINGNILTPNANGRAIRTASTSDGTITINGNIDNTFSNAIAVRLDQAQSLIVNGNVTGSTGTAISNNSSGTITITGNLTGSAGTLINNSSSGPVTITGNLTSTGCVLISNLSGNITINGNITASSPVTLTAFATTLGTITITGNLTNNLLQSGSNLLSQTGNGTINVIGDVFGAAVGNNAIVRTILNSGGGTINVTGNILTGGASSAGTPSTSVVIDNTSGGIVNVTGTVNGASAGLFTGANTVNGIRNNSTGTVNVIGNCIGTQGSFVILAAVYNVVGGTVNITGNAIGGSTGLAVGNAGTGTINLNGNAIGGTSYAAVENSNSSGNLIVEKIVFGVNGQTATRGYIKFKNTVNIAAETVLKTDATTTNLVDINVVPNLQPAISDVRLGVTYSSGSLTGTMNVPPFNAVKAGVPVDNGVGTAYLDAADLWNFMISGITQSGSIGERLKIVSTIETTGTQLASFNV